MHVGPIAVGAPDAATNPNPDPNPDPDPNPNPDPNLDPDPEGGQRAAQVKVFEKREFVSTTWINPISGRL